LDLLAESVAMDPEVLGGARQVAAVLLEDALDELLLELALRVREHYPFFDHLGDERLQLLLHGTDAPLICAAPNAGKVEDAPCSVPGAVTSITTIRWPPPPLPSATRVRE